MKLPLCFVLMPFGKKAAPDGTLIDFDLVYNQLIAPAITAAQLEPLRADEELSGGIIHKAMFERLILCPYAVADLTLSNANVFYELGVRHAFRPFSTVNLVAEGGRLPFDVQMLRTIHYKLTEEGLGDMEATRKAITSFLEEAKAERKDSPIFQLLDQLKPPPLDHLKTDLFRDQVDYAQSVKARLAQARKQGTAAVKAMETELGDIANLDAGIAIDLFLSYRATKGFNEMLELAERFSAPVAQTVLVREQRAFALNRLGRRDEAKQVLLGLIETRGVSSETCGLLGRVYKDQWEEAAKKGSAALAEGYLEEAIEAYLKGFESDFRDAYPGINAVTLMELHDPPDPRRITLLPVVRYAVERKMAQQKPDYWDYATLLELAVLAADERAARKALGRALAAVREPWEPETTGRNLRLIREAREQRGDEVGWLKEVEDALSQRGAT